MNEEKPPITGRTKFDWMSENKDILNRIILILVLILLIVIITLSIVVFGGKHNIKAGTKGIEISPIDVSESKDEKINADTFKKADKPKNPHNQESGKHEKLTSPNSKTELKIGDTSIVVENQPSNINFGNNSVVGNNINSTITVNPREKLTAEEKRWLIKELNLAFRSANRSNKSCVMLMPVYNHPKALELIEDLKPFLIDQGYNVLDRKTGIYIDNPIEKISFKAMDNECLYIVISFND